ncbi:hypothetical protein [Streptomyces sp. NPDC055992]|uniref:hypothetical protein n=1 Tax=Streptomyces sp. NPDC055992 TaxID=3345673 RepID=UPI0035D72BE9
MGMLAAEWYESDTFWTAASVIAAVAVGLGAIWATLRAARPKLRLLFWVCSDTPLLNTSGNDIAGTLTVLHNSVVLTEPRVVEVQLINAGRHDIAASMFHDGDPVCLDLGICIVALLEVSTTSATHRPPAVEVTGNTLTIAPSLLARQQAVTFSLLVDGPSPELSCLASLTDVDVQPVRQQPRQSARAAVFAANVAQGLLAPATSNALGELLGDWSGRRMGRRSFPRR